MAEHVYKKGLQSRTKDSMISFPGKNLPRNSTHAAHPGYPLLELQRKCGNQYVQRMVTVISREGEEVSSEIESAINAKRGGGQPLETKLRMQMESAFGANFSGVRVHNDSKADKLNRALSARAFTTGRDIFFRQGAYNPGSSSGRELLAHELTHVVQQSGDIFPKLTVGQPDSEYEKEADRVARAVVQQEQLRRQPEEEEEELLMKGERQGVLWRNGDESEEAEGVSIEEFDLSQQKADHQRLITRMQSRYLRNLERNATNARFANQRFIEFSESGINQLRTAGTIGPGVAYLFGTPGAVVALCVIVLTEVAAQHLSSRSAKIAAAAARIDARLRDATTEINERFQNLSDQIDSMTSLDWTEWAPVWSEIANIGVPEIVPENIIYRDLLLELARGGGYNVSGSQWNVDNMSIFGDAPWYHSWDWGSPGWVNGQDIADELNELAEGDPSTRIRVSINPP